MSASFNKVLPDLSKLEPLDGTNYRRWSQKLLIFFEQLEIDYMLFEDLLSVVTTKILTTPITPASGVISPSIPDPTKKNEKHDKDNKTVRGHLLNHMPNYLFDLYIHQKSAKKIWNTLEKCFGADDTGKKNYVVGKLLQFQMVDNNPVMEQVHEYENLVADVLNEGMKLCETFQANVLLEKFPPSWNDYRRYLKHLDKDLTLQELISHMKIEEANHLKDKSISLPIDSSIKANVVQFAGPSDKDRFKGKNNNTKKGAYQRKENKFNKSDPKIGKQKLTCYVCSKPGHKAHQCYKRHGQKKPDQTTITDSKS